MRTRMLGRTGLRLSEVGIGCWAMGGPDWNLNLPMGWGGADDEQSLTGLRRAYDLGVNHYDTADVYGHGRSERILGRFLKQVGRDSVVITSKTGYFRGCAPSAYQPLHLRHQLEMSLNNLGTDYIDVYSFHNLHFGDHGEDLEDAVATLRSFQNEGKIRFVGQRGPHRYAPHRLDASRASDNKVEWFTYVAAIVQPDVIQLRYNLLTEVTPERIAALSWAKAHDIGVVINKPLAQGLLLDKYDPTNPPVFDPGDHRSRKQWFTERPLSILNQRLTAVKSRFGTAAENMVHVALQYCLSLYEHAVLVVGIKSKDQAEMNLSAVGDPLSEADLAFLAEAMRGVGDEIGSFFRQT